MRLMLGLMLAGLAVSSCSTPAPAKKAEKTYPYLLVDSVPSGATLTFTGGTTCETPCPVNVTFQMKMTVAKAGYKPVTYTLYGNNPGELVVELELVAPTTSVEEGALPDL
ncbi:PEGA domain-containing protein [Aquisalinus flavus]|uniref:PEGA domain-containing protein n=1 Tax=Aquisalinus flavus TaxID=1526572 RepID=A0A8J2V793_9PROT|nr:PEGA domain-containing protein [Aquisalinus flavus]MBD0427719.1 PEGA domain-containing protein [Aquisalinus flavus]GGD03256.1 hypothetical protein GCM10011342_10340 [Aquisalinus flavus]